MGDFLAERQAQFRIFKTSAGGQKECDGTVRISLAIMRPKKIALVMVREILTKMSHSLCPPA